MAARFGRRRVAHVLKANESFGIYGVLYRMILIHCRTYRTYGFKAFSNSALA
jgi:hypothetical protein